MRIYGRFAFSLHLTNVLYNFSIAVNVKEGTVPETQRKNHFRRFLMSVRTPAIAVVQQPAVGNWLTIGARKVGSAVEVAAKATGNAGLEAIKAVGRFFATITSGIGKGI